ncbi:hypothetical protein WL67_20900 [Burkholderia ubonensis]|nr:hypothetical protein WL67_20900 [Burkholderia ubonensis]KWD60480.1 hypothetical protein WL66_05485 [Burkholderia ubonensis]
MKRAGLWSTPPAPKEADVAVIDLHIDELPQFVVRFSASDEEVTTHRLSIFYPNTRVTDKFVPSRNIVRKQ